MSALCETVVGGWRSKEDGWGLAFKIRNFGIMKVLSESIGSCFGNLHLLPLVARNR